MSGDPGEFPEYRKTLEERVRELNEKVQELDCVRSAFVSVVSHELRTPMTSIRLCRQHVRRPDRAVEREAVVLPRARAVQCGPPDSHNKRLARSLADRSRSRRA